MLSIKDKKKIIFCKIKKIIWDIENISGLVFK